MTRDETAKLLAVIRASWQRAKIDDPEAMLTAYHLGLRNVSYSDAEEAVVACIETCTFMPTVAEIRERLPKAVGLDVGLYQRFGQLHGHDRTDAEDQEYAALCRKLGVGWVAAENPSRRRRLELAG